MRSDQPSPIATFLAADTFAVAGASSDRAKYGNKVFRALVDSGRTTYPLNRTAQQIEGHTAFDSIVNLPEVPQSLSIVTPPHVTRGIVEQAISAGVQNIWMQPGAEDRAASQAARAAGLVVIDDGSCVLVSLSLADKAHR